MNLIFLFHAFTCILSEILSMSDFEMHGNPPVFHRENMALNCLLTIALVNRYQVMSQL